MICLVRTCEETPFYISSYGFFQVSSLCICINLVPRAFLRREEVGREKTLASAGHVAKLNGTLSTNVCKCLENPRF